MTRRSGISYGGDTSFADLSSDRLTTIQIIQLCRWLDSDDAYACESTGTILAACKFAVSGEAATTAISRRPARIK